jgi:PKD repeat protein
MYKKLLLATASLFVLGQAQSQNNIKVPQRNLLEAKNSAELNAIYEENIAVQLKYAKEVLGLNLLPQVMSNGTVVQVTGVTETGMPIYTKTENSGAAITIGTNKVNPGGSLGLNLTGSGLTNRIGVWDGGAVRTSHQEFQGRAIQTDGAGTIIDHATHVAGTMVGGGVQANAKGMSFQAPIKCYDWNSDNSEMTTAAAAGMLISNHSYGSICGWSYDDNSGEWRWYGNVSVSTVEDVNFGLYDSKTQQWDQIVYNNPFFLPFKSAGNDRGDVASGTGAKKYFDNNVGNWVSFTSTLPPADGQYDCITTYGNAKNIITIGAVNKISNGWNGASSVVMSSFSGWGPTDDGRIKPDVCAAGVNLYSSISTSNSAYASLSGTSMASPNASGSALLIQQQYNNLKGKFMRASTLKGLIIQTADEAGTTTGPDYKFGWGLMNTAKAVQLISDSTTNEIIENQINTNLAPFVKTVVSNGTTPLKLTLCWTDVPGTASFGNVLDEATPKLVNDLDVRIIRVSDNQEFFPYVLNPSSPNAAATTGDNTRDNVEQIVISAPTAGTYTIRITSKKTLANNANQTFSLIVSGVSPKPAANFSVSSQMSCVGNNITFTNSSSSSSSVIWYFPGGTPATSTANNPVVTYSKSGVYSVALKVVGIAGTDSIFRTNYIRIGGINLPINETFENNSPTAAFWRTTNNYANDTFGWRKWNNTQGTSPGNTVFGINFYDNPTLNRRYQLMSPIIDLRGMQNASLSFQHAYTRYSTEKDSLIVSISTNCGASWIRLQGLTENRANKGTKMATYTAPGESLQTSSAFFVPSATSHWCNSVDTNSSPCNNINLNSYIGLNNVMIRFEAFNGAGNNLFLDNINISGTPFSPKAGFTVPTLVCSNQSFVLSDTSINNPSGWDWTITGPQNLTFNTQNPQVNLSTPGVYQVKLKVWNVSGTDSIIVNNSFEVKPSPAKPNISLVGSLNICDNDSVTVTTNAASAQWYRDSTLLIGETGATFINKLPGKIAARNMAANGCAAQSDILSFNYGTRPPVAVITKSLTSNSFCEGGSFTLTSSATSGNQWVINNTDMAGQTNQNLSYSDTGTFNVKVYNGVCYSISEPLTITKKPKPNTSDITASRYAYKNDTATYWVQGLSTSTFSWSINGGVLQSGQNTNTIVVKWSTGANGVVSVTEKGANGCNGTLKTYPVGIWNTSTQTISISNDFVVYPNPANQQLNIKFLNNNNAGLLTVKIFDILGKNILSQQVDFGQNAEYMIDVNGLNKGIYIVKLEGENVSGSKIISKE